MRPTVLGVALAILPLLAPTLLAGSGQGSTVGVDLGYVQPGLWDMWWFEKAGGTSAATIVLSWEESLFPGADYDLRLYREGALDDRRLSSSELLAASETRTFDPHQERIDATLAPGVYVVVVVPFQTQGEVYTLQADPGFVDYAGVALGCTSYRPFERCPFL